MSGSCCDGSSNEGSDSAVGHDCGEERVGNELTIDTRLYFASICPWFVVFSTFISEFVLFRTRGEN